MRKSFPSPVQSLFSGLLLTAATALTTPAAIVDDFNDNTKTDWQDFTAVPGLGVPVETGGQFKFVMPAVGQSIFSATRKTSAEYELKNGRTIEFKVDLVTGLGKDSFAILAFIPTVNSLGTLSGYGLAKSTTDILLTKGIGKYFYAANPATAIKTTT